MAKKMNKVQKVIVIAEVNALRGFCRWEAKHHKAKGRLKSVKGWNDLAYTGDLLFERAMNN